MLTAAAGVAVVAYIISAGVGIGLASLSTTLREGLNGPGSILIFAVLSALTTVLVLLDDACIGLLRGDLQLRRNAVFAVSKLALLPILIWAWSSQSGMELVVAWMGGLAISLATLGVQLAKLTKGQSSRLDLQRILDKRRLVMGHHWLNLSIQSPRLILPVLVAIIVGPAANAAFTAAFLVVSFVNVIPSQLSTVLFALAPGDEADLHLQVRKTMRICLVISVVTAPLFVIFAPLILRIFGHDYVTAAAALAILGFATYPQTIKAHYVAIAVCGDGCNAPRCGLWSAAVWKSASQRWEQSSTVSPDWPSPTSSRPRSKPSSSLPRSLGWSARNRIRMSKSRLRKASTTMCPPGEATITTKECVTLARSPMSGFALTCVGPRARKLGGFQHG